MQRLAFRNIYIPAANRASIVADLFRFGNESRLVSRSYGKTV